MSTTLVSVDRTALPASLLPLAKTHMRVEFSRDDEYIKLCLARGIDFFERTTELVVNPTKWEWVPWLGAGITLPNEAGGYGWQIPFQPAPTWKVYDVKNGVDISAGFSMLAYAPADQYGVRWLVASAGQPTASPFVDITLGYADAASMPPGILGFVLEAAGWYYENREIGPMPGVDGVSYLNQLLTGYWVPRA